jgi:hypothetical protein
VSGTICMTLLTASEITNNTAAQSGGGVMCQGSKNGGSKLFMSAGTKVVGNAASVLGGGAHLKGGCVATLSSGVVFASNTAGKVVPGRHCEALFPNLSFQ